MIRFAPELESLQKESRDLIGLFARSAPRAATLARWTQDGPVTHFVRMPRVFQVGVTFRDSTLLVGVPGVRAFRAVRDDGRLTLEDKGVHDTLRTQLDVAAAEMRDVLHKGALLVAAIEQIPEGAREADLTDIVPRLRAALKHLERLAYDVIDRTRALVPHECEDGAT
jgi:hypothetical protein